MAVCQNLVPLENIKIAGKWMFIPLKMVLIGIDPYPHLESLMNREEPCDRAAKTTRHVCAIPTAGASSASQSFTGIKPQRSANEPNP
jgi:hypothetical protein